jgi:NTE family protein
MKPILRLLAIPIFLLCGLPALLGAQTGPQEPVRVGLALSGGGAMGLAHIGVLRYFEQHHIPIADLAGTSIGGLIGGLYSTGMDSGQLTTIVENADWDALLNPLPKFIDQPVVDKQDWNRTFGSLTLQFGEGFSLPEGLNSGEALSLLLSRQTLAYSDVRNFDDLPTPFRCVATDLITGQVVILQRGSLPQAMRATMSIPGVFTPVRLDGMVLVDGGFVQMVPVETVRSMGAQKVVAVALPNTPVKPEQIKSLPDVLRQTVSASNLQNERRSLALADVVIAVDTSSFNIIDYKKWREIIQAGYDAASKMSAQLKQFEVSQQEWDSYLQARRRRTHSPISSGHIVAIDAPSVSFRRDALAEIRRKFDHRAVTPHALEELLTGIASATAVPSAIYEWQSGSPDPAGYKVVIARRAGDRSLLRPSLQYRLSPGEPDQTSLRISTATVFENAYKARLLANFDIGFDPGMHVEYYHPFGGSPFFVVPGSMVQRFHVYSYRGPTRVNQHRDRVAGSLHIGVGTWRFAQLRMGLWGGYDSYSSSPTVDGVKANSGAFISPEVSWLVDSQDSGGLPTRGVLVEGSSGYSFRDVDYPWFRQHFSVFQPVGKKFSLLAMGKQATSFGRKLDYFEQFTAGGAGQLSAFRYQEFHANTLVDTGAGAAFRLPAIPGLSIDPGLAAWHEVGRFDMGSQHWQTHQSSSAGVFLPTPLGALGVTLSFDETGRARWRLMLGSQ